MIAIKVILGTLALFWAVLAVGGIIKVLTLKPTPIRPGYVAAQKARANKLNDRLDDADQEAIDAFTEQETDEIPAVGLGLNTISPRRLQ